MRATRAWLLACAALALACAPLPRAAAAAPRDLRLDHIKHQILAKLGLSTRPTPLGAPPRDVVRRILARAADPRPAPPPRHTENSMREVIAIAHRGDKVMGPVQSNSEKLHHFSILEHFSRSEDVVNTKLNDPCPSIGDVMGC